MTEKIIREAKRKTLSLMHNVQYHTQKLHLDALIDNFDPTPISNVRPDKITTIAFIITRLVRFHGGQTSVLRLGTALAKRGYHVLYLVYKQQSVSEMKFCASSNLADYEGKVASFDAYFEGMNSGRFVCPDVVVASSWDTVSYAKRFDKSYRMYFVQDYEPYFYAYGEEFLMARSTYEQGLHMVSLGDWNCDMINRECNIVSPLDSISFPYEAEEYPEGVRNYAAYPDKQKFTIAVYLKFYGKRLPNLIPHMLKQVASDFRNNGLELEVLYYGEAGTFSAEGGTNLGHLNKEELASLYRRADFGMVASMSNISLVPYEMHASGLPVIEFADGTYPYFFPENTAVLTSFGDTKLSDKLLEVIRNPYILENMHTTAKEYLSTLSWERTGAEFADILNKCIDAERKQN